MKFGILVFPGSNCDHDTFHVVASIARQPAVYLWHASSDLQGCDAIVVPGGFAYGDYLRTGAIARFAPIMGAVKRFAAAGGPVLGICNGFQILCEAGLLPGALMRNASQRYICRQVHLRAETSNSPFTGELSPGDVPAHAHRPHGGQLRLRRRDPRSPAARRPRRLPLRRTRPAQQRSDANPNGSLDNIAGVLSEGRNVLGMMPHPDRSSEALLGSADGLTLFAGLARSLATT